MENLAKIKQRVIQYIESQKIKKEVFYRKISSNGGNFRGKSLKSELSGEKIAEILAIYPEINPDWLLTGRGEMLRSAEPIGGQTHPDREKYIEVLEAALADKEKIVKLLEDRIKQLEGNELY